MRYRQLVEHVRNSEWGEFLEWADLWASEGGGNEFEHYPGREAEAHMLRLRHVVADYATPDYKMLFRGTGGISRRQAAALKRSRKPIIFDMSETNLSSWTTNPEIAKRFSDSFKGVVLGFPAGHFDVIVSFAHLWRAMSSAERQDFPGIGLASSEAEILVQHRPSYVVKPENLF